MEYSAKDDPEIEKMKKQFREQYQKQQEEREEELAPFIAQEKCLICDVDEKNKSLEQKLAECEGKLEGVVKWLERNQPDVFARGMWRAIELNDILQSDEGGVT